jgi:hypothetical protein
MDALVGADGGPSPVPVIYSDQIRAHPDLPMMRCEKKTVIRVVITEKCI